MDSFLYWEGNMGTLVSKIIWILVILLIAGGIFFIGFQSGIAFKKNVYQTLFSTMCEYTNKLTDLANNQSEFIELCMNKPKNDMGRLKYVSCNAFG